MKQMRNLQMRNLQMTHQRNPQSKWVSQVTFFSQMLAEVRD